MTRRLVLAGTFTGPVVRVRGPLEAADALASALIAGRQQRERDEAAAPAPRQIVEQLHEEIARFSPDHAALVAEFRQLRQRGALVFGPALSDACDRDDCEGCFPAEPSDCGHGCHDDEHPS